MSRDAVALEELLTALDSILDGDARRRIVDGLTRTGSFEEQLRRLRSAMRDHAFRVGEKTVDLSRPVRRLDQRTREDGFRVLHAWDHTAHRFTDEIVPVLLLDYYDRARATSDVVTRGRVTLEILLDTYLFHVLTLCTMRVWDAADRDATLVRLTRSLEALQGPGGSGHHFVGDSETMLIYALSQFHPEEHAYDRMIERVVTLGEGHQVAFARVSAAVLSAHLRWGFWLMYGRDVVRMRDDNVGDYPWLLNSVLTLLRDFVRSIEAGEPPDARAATGVALLQGFAADPWAFGGKAPASLADYPEAYAETRELLERHGDGVLAELDAHAPRKEGYSPLALHFNFPHNTLVAILTLALLRGQPQPLPLNALFDEGDTGPVEALARDLMAFSRSSPDRLGARGAMLIAYDPLSAMRSYTMTMQRLRGASGSPA